MTPEQIEKANWLSGIYTSVACGETLQVHEEGEWRTVEYASPNLQSNPERWRIKPKPARAWVVWTERPIGIFLDRENASATATLYGGTIQEITRPEL
jgi:hypothetical protein